MIRDIQLFPTLVRVIERAVNESDFIDALYLLDPEKLSPHSLFVNALSGHLYNSPVKNDWLEQVPKIRQTIVEHVSAYSQEYGIHTGLNITTSFINYYAKDGYIKEHAHANSVVSGVWYLDVDESSSGLSLVNPNPHVDLMPTKELNWYSITRFTLPVKKNMLILFPSWLRHFTPPNPGDHRWVCSFNTHYERFS